MTLSDSTQRILRKWESETNYYRACDLCVYGTGWEGMRYCNHKESIKQGNPVEIHRAKGGHCGPEAKNLYIPPRETRIFIDNKSRAAGEREE